VKERPRGDHDRNADHAARAQRFGRVRARGKERRRQHEAGGEEPKSRDYGFGEAGVIVSWLIASWLMALWLMALWLAEGLGCVIAACIESCDIALCVGLALGCAMAECIESCMALGLGDWADAAAEIPPSMAATTIAVGMYFIKVASQKEWMRSAPIVRSSGRARRNGAYASSI